MMRSCHAAAAVDVAFDDPNLIADAGLVPVVGLAEQIGLPALVAEHVSINGAANSAGANPAAKVLSLLAGMVAGADSIEDVDRLRHAGNQVVFDEIRAPSTLGTFLRAFTQGHVQQLNTVLRQATGQAVEPGHWCKDSDHPEGKRAQGDPNAPTVGQRHVRAARVVRLAAWAGGSACERRPPADGEVAAVASDLGRAGAGEVRWHDELSGVGGAFQHAATGGGRLLRVLAKAAVVARLEDLDGAVQQVADEHGPGRAGGQADDRGTGGVAGRGHQAEIAVDAVAVLPQHGPAQHRHDAVGVEDAASVLAALLVLVAWAGAPVGVVGVEVHLVGARDQVGGVRECRHPRAVAQLGVPADVVVVDVCVDDDVDVLRSDPGFGQPVQEAGAQVVEEGDLRAVPVVADPGVDEDDLALAAQHPCLHGAVVGVGLRAPVVGREPGLVVLPDLGRAVRDDDAGGGDLTLPFDDLGDLDLAELKTDHTAKLGGVACAFQCLNGAF